MHLRAILTPNSGRGRRRGRPAGGRRVAPVLVPGLVAAVTAGTAACVSGGAGDDGRPQVVVTTSLLGDVVGNLVGDEAAVEVLVPAGADPHEASLSARQADEMLRADLVVVSGAGFEQSMSSVLEAVEQDGADLFAVADHVDTVTFADHHAPPEGPTGPGPGHHDGEDAARAGGHHDAAADEGDGEGDGDEHGPSGAGDHGHDHDPDDVDPHFWTDPTRMVAATEALADRLAAIEGLSPEAVEANAAAYVAELEALDAEIAETLAAVPDDRRVLVTNHEVFGYFADRYGFTVVGTVIPAGTTQAEPSSAEVEALADTVADTGVPAIFVETSAASGLAEALADAAGDVEVVELFSESLGEEGSGGETYLAMMRTDAERIAGALA